MHLQEHTVLELDHGDQAQYLLHYMTYAPAKFEVITLNHLQESTLFGLDLGPRAHEMLPNTFYIILYFCKKIHSIINLDLGSHKMLPSTSTSCDLFRCNVKVAASNGLGGNTFTRNVTDGRAHTWTDGQTGRLRYEINILVFLKKKTCIIIEPWHVISNNVVGATSKASDQPAHMRSLIRAFASRLSIL